MKTAQSSASTQHFTELIDIREDIVMLHGGNACVVIEIQAVNFALLSPEEQDAKVYAYAALLNSLSFPVQILVRSKKIEILPYIDSLSLAAQRTANTKLAESIKKYKAFVEDLVTMTTVLDKQFYMVIAYSSLEEGVSGAAKMAHMSARDLDDFFTRAKASLHTKAETLLSQIDRMNLRARVLQHDALIHVYHDMFNGIANPGVQVQEHAVTATKGAR